MGRGISTTTAGGRHCARRLADWRPLTFSHPYSGFNPPIAVGTVGLLLISAPKDGGIQRKFDVIGAVIAGFGARGARLGAEQIGPTYPQAAANVSNQSDTELTIVARLGIAWSRYLFVLGAESKHPMTPPR